MIRSQQPPYDRILWTLVSPNGESEWIKLRRRTKLRAAELDAVLSKLVKDGKDLDYIQGNLGAKKSRDPAQEIGMKSEILAFLI